MDIKLEIENIKTMYGLDFSTPEKVRDVIARVEERAMQSPNQVDFDDKVKHHFSKGVYARELFIPAGTLIVGKIHRHENFNILSKGEMLVISIDGIQKVSAPFSVVSSPGVKRLAIAYTDCIWTTIHGTSETDLEKIEDQFIVKSYDELNKLEKKESVCLGGQ